MAHDSLADLFARQAERLTDPEMLERIHLGHWPRVDADILDGIDRILARLRGRRRPLRTRLLDRWSRFRTMSTGSAHPEPADLTEAQLAAVRARLPAQLAVLVRGGRIAPWEREAFLGDLRGLSHDRLARAAGCNRWRLECSLLRLRRRLIQNGALGALQNAAA